MAEYSRADAERVAAKISSDLAANGRFRATARGLARSNMVIDGRLLDYAPTLLTQDLDEQLSAIGAGLLSSGLEGRDIRDAVPNVQGILPADLIAQAFENAGECFEALVTNGDGASGEKGFHNVLSGAAYHLAGFSARAFNVLRRAPAHGGGLTFPEKILRCLILRDFEQLDGMAEALLRDREAGDEVLLKRLLNPEDSFEEVDIVHRAMQENYCRAIARFVYAMRVDAGEEIDVARTMLWNGEAFCLGNGFVTDWWLNRISRHLVWDLWQHSLRRNLPLDPDHGAIWNSLREIFIASLASRRLAEVELWPSQRPLMPRLMDETDDLVVSLPTSAGKTRIAELCILRCLAGGRRAVFVTPLRSLSAQTERTLRRTFRPLGFDVSSLYGAAGTTSADADSLSNRDVVVCTPEKLDFALRSDPSLLVDVGLVVFDEGHMLGATDRGIRYEVLVQRLLRREDQKDRRVVCLSAVLPSGEMEDDFVSWLRSGAAGEALKRNWRPTRQRFGKISLDTGRGSYRYDVRMGNETSFVRDFIVSDETVGPRGGRTVFPSSAAEVCLTAAVRLAREGQSVLIYCPQKNHVRQMARRYVELLQARRLVEVGVDESKVRRALYVGQEWLPENDPVLDCLRAGIAVHHASLPRAFLRELDTLLGDGTLKVTIASPTLAQGLNLSAKCLLLHSFNRFNSATGRQEPLTAEELANVAGRAGRAFVDNDGLVIGICRSAYDVARWESLVSSVANRKLESGLVLLIDALLDRLRKSLPVNTWPDTAEYILNNRDFWSAPPAKLAADDSWNDEIAMLDSALLSLLGDVEGDDAGAATALDRMLSDSFVMRRLARGSIERRERVIALLKSRSGYIWRNTTVAQRRGYFFAGVGLATGRLLDAAAPELNRLILEAEAALEVGHEDEVIVALTAVAKIVFQIEPFALDEDLPSSWPELLAGWLKGLPMAVLCGIAENASDVVEGAFVYRLTWAIDAVRVRSEANEEGMFGETELGCTAALEAGTTSREVAMLVQAGMPSRTAAQEALRAFPAKFESFGGLRAWLREPQLRKASERPDWPTSETAVVWKEFMAQQDMADEAEWQRIDAEMVLGTNFPFGPGTVGWLRPTSDARDSEFLTTEMESGGFVDFTFPKNGPTWARATVTKRGTLFVSYLGPWPSIEL